MKLKIKNLSIIIFIFILFTLYLLKYNIIIPNIKEYTKLFINNPLPTTSLILLFTNLLIENNLFYHIKSPNKYINILTIINGFPTPIIEISNLYKSKIITKETANNYLTFSYLPNMYIFLIPINNIIKNNLITIKIVLSIILSNIIIKLISTKKRLKYTVATNKVSFYKSITRSVNKTVKIITIIYGTSLFFYLISQLIINYIKPSPIIYIIINNVFDLTYGLSTFNIINNCLYKYILIIMFLSFGNINIHWQIKSIIDDAYLDYNYFLVGRITCTIISLLIFLLLY